MHLCERTMGLLVGDKPAWLTSSFLRCLGIWVWTPTMEWQRIGVKRKDEYYFYENIVEEYDFCENNFVF